MGVATQHFRHNELGHVYILVKPTAKSIKARWKGAMLQVTCPEVSPDELMRALNDMAPKLLAVRPKSRYHIGQRFDFELFSVVLVSQKTLPGTITRQFDGDRTYTLGIGSAIDIDTEQGEGHIEIALCNIALRYANAMLLREAHDVAMRVGAYPLSGFKLARGLKRLGCCKGRRLISLSYVLAFMPRQLREYIICHELAHITHMDHSPAFHALVDKYTGGNESRLEAELRAFKFPINR